MKLDELNPIEKWPPDRLRMVRSRMGWSQAEMARQLRVDFERVEEWERGLNSPEARLLSHLEYLENQADSCAEMLQRKPIAESMMLDNGLSQICEIEVIEQSVVVAAPINASEP